MRELAQYSVFYPTNIWINIYIKIYTKGNALIARPSSMGSDGPK